MKTSLEYLESLPDWIKVTGCLLVSFLLGVADYITGDFSLSLFYVFPIAFASWFIGKRTALYVAVVCGMELYTVNLLVAPGKVSIVSLRSWNALMEVSYLFLTAFLISVVRAEMEKSRQRSIELELLNHELTAFSYTVAHDLRSPLVWIGGYCHSILKNHGDSLDKTAREYLKEICEGTIKMEKLISSLLELSRVSQGELAPEFVDLSAIAKNVADGLLLAEPGRKVTFRIAEELITKGDQQLLSVVLDNLLSNALKYTSEEEEASIEFGAMKYRGNKAYYVRDNGAGFDMSFAEKLFIPFNRLHSADRFKGHGIGLATVKKIINRHKGEIWAQSKVGGGTTFYFTLNSDVAN